MQEVFYIELEDTSMNGINLNFLLIRNPDGPCFETGRDDEGHSTLFGTARRNLTAEEQATTSPARSPASQPPRERLRVLVFMDGS